MPCKMVVGLTGGVGSGKSAASEMFSQHDVPIIDTDVIAREVVQPGQPAIALIEQAFGPTVMTPAGAIDRATLRRRIFSDPTLRTTLEQILHPRIRALAAQRIQALEAPYCIVVVPLLIESKMLEMVNRVLVIDAPESEQIARVRMRDDISHEEAERMLKAQASRSERLAKADDVIVNDGSRADLRMAVEELHRQYLLRSRGDPLT